MLLPLRAPTLQTRRLRLRAFTEADTEVIYALQSNAHVLRYWDSPPRQERARADRFNAMCWQLGHDGSGKRLV